MPRAVQNHVPGLVRGGNLAGPTIRGVARPKTASGDWYATRKAPIGGFHAHIQGWGGVRISWMTRGSAQSVHADLGTRGSPTRSARSAARTRSPCPGAQGPAPTLS